MSLNNFVKRIRNEMRNDAGINGDAQRIEQLAWMLFLKVYDTKEDSWEVTDDDYTSIIPENCRWRTWAQNTRLTGDDLLKFVNDTVFKELKDLDVTNQPPKKAIVKSVFEDANQYMKDGVQLRKVLNIIDELNLDDYQESHAFGDIYESILKEMQSAGSSGEFYTPRALTDFMAKMVCPQLGERMADFACGTGGFMTSWLHELKKNVKNSQDQKAWSASVYGMEKKQFPYMLAVTNLLLQDIDAPDLHHGNSFTIKSCNDYTEKDAFDVILMNPPYGGSEKDNVKNNFPAEMKSSETADLFIALIMHRLKAGGRAAVIIPDGFLFGMDNAKQAIKKKMLTDFNLHTVIRLPGSIFSPYTSIATNLLFFNRPKNQEEGTMATSETWFYRLDMPEGYKHFSKTKPMTLAHCAPIEQWWHDRREIILDEGNEKSRKFTVQELIQLDYNFDQCKFPKDEETVLPPNELLAHYYQKRNALNHEIDQALGEIQKILGIDINP